MTTIRDIAKSSGVSVGTVSNVINNVPTVKEEVKRRVLKTINELNYSPSHAAKSLASGYTQTLAFIVPDICNPFFPEMVRGAVDTAKDFGYDIFLANIDNDPKKEIQYIANFIARGVDGLIIATSDCSSEQVQQIRKMNIYVVIVDREIEDLERDLVMVDNVRCAYIAVRHLINLGHERIGIILGPMQTMTARQRLKGAKMALMENGLFDETLVKSGGYSFENGFQIIQGYLLGGKSIEAVFCANDMIAIGAIKAIEEAGCRVPDDISVIGIDDIMISRLINPPLTTVRQPIFDLGAIATKMVIERIQGTVTGVPRKVILPGELIVRQSTSKRCRKHKQPLSGKTYRRSGLGDNPNLNKIIQTSPVRSRRE